jgi:hypothetical protein
MAGARKASTVAEHGEALIDFKHLRLAGMARFYCNCVTKMLLCAAREYLTASKNDVVLSLVQRI